ncbi:MAG: hypothetical protein ACJ79H_10050 [Myxococcales bacterium]
MGAIKSDFENLPKEDAKGAAAAFAAVCADLERLGLPRPAGKTPPEQMTREELLAHLQTIAGELVGRYIAGKPDALDGAADDWEIAARISARLGEVWGALPYAPNAITAVDVSAARMMGG